MTRLFSCCKLPKIGSSDLKTGFPSLFKTASKIAISLIFASRISREDRARFWGSNWARSQAMTWVVMHNFASANTSAVRASSTKWWGSKNTKNLGISSCEKKSQMSCVSQVPFNPKSKTRFAFWLGNQLWLWFLTSAQPLLKLIACCPLEATRISRRTCLYPASNSLISQTNSREISIFLWTPFRQHG